MTYPLIGLIVAIFVIFCAIAIAIACMMSSQCSQDEAQEAKAWRYAQKTDAVRGEAKWKAARTARRNGE